MRETHDPEDMNGFRAEAATEALAAYAEFKNIGDEDYDTQLRDLLCDLHHLADEQDVDLGQCYRMGRASYLEETAAPSARPATEDDVEALTAHLYHRMLGMMWIFETLDILDEIIAVEDDRKTAFTLDQIHQATSEAENRFINACVQNECNTEKEGRTDLDPLEQRIAKWEALRPANRRRAELAAALSEKT